MNRRLIHRALSLLALAATVAPIAAHAQTVSPPVVEYRERAKSSFQLLNATLYPMVVTLQPQSFSVNEQGEIRYAPLDTARVRLRLSATSFQIPPRGSYTVYYEASAPATPSWFVITSTLSGARTSEGMNLRIQLPHVVYLNQREPLQRSDVVIRSFAVSADGKKATVELENTSDRLGRVRTAEIASASHREQLAGFPMFPRSRRRVEIPWTGAGRPERLEVKFAGFSLEQTASPALASQ